MSSTIQQANKTVNRKKPVEVNYDHPLMVAAKKYEYVRDKKRAWEVLRALDPEQVHALDFETTSLFPEWGEVRLSSVTGNGHAFILDHFYCGPFTEFAEFFSKKMWAVFNSCFEGNWIDDGSMNNNVVLYDIGHMRRAKMGGGPLSLKIQAMRDHDLTLIKDEQNSSWSKPELTQSQLDYAFLDAVVTWASYEKWLHELTPEQWDGFLVINEAWRGTVEMQDTGLCLDTAYHGNLLDWWKLKHETAERYLRRWTPPPVLSNLRSKKQISDFLQKEVLDHKAAAAWPKTGKRGDLNLERNTLIQAAHRLPYPVNRWMAALIIFNKMEKYISTYGQKLIDAQNKLGKVPSRFNMAQAVTGRYSSSSFNLQNIPRNPVVRRSFICPKSVTGNVVKLVMADYSSIEVRVLAELAGDEQLLYDAIYGDVHSRSASQIFALDFDYFVEILHSDDEERQGVKTLFKAYRSRAKAFTFQLLYGAGAAALSVVLKCTDDEAFKAVEAWASIYPKAYHQRQIWYETMMHSGFLPVADGRTIFVIRQDRTMPVAANYPVQGAAASVMYRAVYHVNKLLYNANINCRMAASVHDELLLYAHEHCAEEAASLLVTGMEKAWLDIFPRTDTTNLIGEGNVATIGDNWGAK